MRIKSFLSVLVGLTCVICVSVSASWGFVFSSPAAGTTIDVGSTVTVDLDPEGVGPLVGILFVAGTKGRVLGSEYVVLSPYRWTLQLPRDYIGPVTFTAMGQVMSQKTGTAPKAEVTIYVKLPSNAILQQMRVRNDQKTLFMKVNEKRTIRVYGIFSDGIERHVESAASGTTYSSSDEQIAVASSEGRVTAIAPGKAVITIRNGNKKLAVNVSVEAD